MQRDGGFEVILVSLLSKKGLRANRVLALTETP